MGGCHKARVGARGGGGGGIGLAMDKLFFFCLLLAF